MKHRLIAIFAFACLQACAAGPYVQTTTTAYHVPAFSTSGRLIVLPSNEELEDSLQFEHYRRVLESKFEAHGFETTRNFADANYLAYVSYGIDDGTSREVSVPIFGQTGGGTTSTTTGTARTTGTGNLAGHGSTTTLSSRTYTMPTYGIIGYGSSTQTAYKRAVAIDIVNLDLSLRSGKTEKVYEARAVSEGSCGQINEVLDEILEAMFQEFPGPNGQSVQVRVPGSFNC